MRLTPFGEAVRLLRMRCDTSLKQMAEFMNISSAHLSGIEYGEKRLSDKHIDMALAFFESKISDEEMLNLREASDKSKDIVNTAELDSDARGLVAAFARRLQEGDAPTEEIRTWLKQK